jgi:sulfide dehydrogenase cytochrome subunit
VSGFESISGKSASDMFKTLVEMKNRPAETIMDRQARGYTDAQLRLIAEYLAKLPPAGATTQEK